MMNDDKISYRVTLEFDTLARRLGYIRLDPGQVVVDAAKFADMEEVIEQMNAEHAAGYFDALARSNGYQKIGPGQVVVNKALHELALSMAHKWEQYMDNQVCHCDECETKRGQRAAVASEVKP